MDLSDGSGASAFVGRGSTFRMCRGDDLSSGELMLEVVDCGEEMAVGGSRGRIREGGSWEMERWRGRGVGVDGEVERSRVERFWKVGLVLERCVIGSEGEWRMARAER